MPGILANPGMYHRERNDSNIAFSLHFAGGVIIVILGVLQYIPMVRRSFNFVFHRWNGRIALVGCINISMLICLVPSNDYGSRRQC